MGIVCVLLGGRSKEITYQATGLVKESCMKIVADLRGLPGGPHSMGRGRECRRKWKHTAPASLTTFLHSTSK